MYGGAQIGVRSDAGELGALDQAVEKSGDFGELTPRIPSSLGVQEIREGSQFSKLPRQSRKIVRVLSPEEFECIQGKARPTHRFAFLLAAHAGLRAGEVRGLRWCDVDLKLAHLVVRQSISFRVATTPKSGHERIVPLTS